MIRVIMLLLSLTILVALHEMGHYLPARWFDTKVKKFYLFFDFLFPFSTLLPYSLLRIVYDSESNKVEFFKNKTAITFFRTSHSKTDTEYGLGYFPMGGYVQIAGMVDESQDLSDMEAEPQPWEFRSKKAWQRLIIMIGGVTVNFVLGVLIFSMMLWFYGKEYLPNDQVKYGIYADSTAQYIGFKTGDKIVSVGGKAFEKFNGRAIIRDIVINNANYAEVIRDGKEETINFKQADGLAGNSSKDIVFISPRVPFYIGEIDSKLPAKDVDLKKDDKIIAINGSPIIFEDEFRTIAMQNKGKEISITRVRNNTDTSTVKVVTTAEGIVGIKHFNLDKYFEIKRQKYSFLESFPTGFSDGVGFIGDQLKAFGQMFKGKIKASESMGGIGSMAKMFPETWDWEAFWRMTGILSLVLAFMNLLPIPGLDGGYVIFLIWEMVTGKKPNDAIVEKATSIGLLILIGLMIYANGLDIIRAWFTK